MNSPDITLKSGIKIFTIGFSKKSARQFFNILQQAGVKKVVDIRLNNVSQLAGFTKKDDLEFFLHSVGADCILTISYWSLGSTGWFPTRTAIS